MFCSRCGVANDDNDYKCTACGDLLHPESKATRYVNEGAGFERLLPTKNPPALWGYYLGVFSLIPCLGLVLGPAAAVCGWIGLRSARELPARIGRTHAWVALILGVATSLLNWGAALSILFIAAAKH